MKFKTISIQNVAGIRSVEIKFNERMNIICGPNGIGKTTILECCAHTFSAGDTEVLKSRISNSDFEKNIGTVNSLFEVDGVDTNVSIEIGESDPQRSSKPYGAHKQSPFLFSIKTQRIFNYSPLKALERDSVKAEHTIYTEAKNGISANEIKNWFAKRDLFSERENALSSEQKDNYILAKKCFESLNPEFKFSHVTASSYDIYVNTPDGKIVYEYLSSGFKSCLTMLLGLIKEIEIRFPNKKVSDIAGIVLIDEVELHLHPEWQGKIVKVLVEIFPNMQFILTTHSPHIIQSADRNQIIALEFYGSSTRIRSMPLSEYGFKGWTVDEVLTDVMGMSDTRSEFFSNLQSDFNNSLDNKDKNKALKLYEIFKKTLHPNNVELKLANLQIAATDWGVDD